MIERAFFIQDLLLRLVLQGFERGMGVVADAYERRILFASLNQFLDTVCQEVCRCSRAEGDGCCGWWVIFLVNPHLVQNFCPAAQKRSTQRFGDERDPVEALVPHVGNGESNLPIALRFQGHIGQYSKL